MLWSSDTATTTTIAPRGHHALLRDRSANEERAGFRRNGDRVHPPSGARPLVDEVGGGSHSVDRRRDQRCFPLESVLSKLAALIHAVPLAALTHDPLVVTQMQPDQYTLGAFPKLFGNGIRNP